MTPEQKFLDLIKSTCPNDSLNKPMIWINCKCIKCKEYVCKIMTAEVVKTPMILCKECYEKQIHPSR